MPVSICISIFVFPSIASRMIDELIGEFDDDDADDEEEE